MRVEELAVPGGDALHSVEFHPQFTVVSGLGTAGRRQLADRIFTLLSGTPAGAVVPGSLVLMSASGRRLRLERDGSGLIVATRVDGPDDDPAESSPVVAHLQLDVDGLRSLMLLDAIGTDMAADHGPSGDAELDEVRRQSAEADARYEATRAQLERMAELRDGIAHLEEEIRAGEEAMARYRHGQTAQAVSQLQVELALLGGGPPEERRLVEALLAAIGAGEDWREANDAAAAAADAYGNRPMLDPAALQTALKDPTEPPADMDQVYAAYAAADERCSRLLARLADDSADDLPTPSTPWVRHLACLHHPDLWPRAERAIAARDRAHELAIGIGSGGDLELVTELEIAHRAVEEAERELSRGKLPGRVLAVRHRLAKAEEAERAVLERAGFSSWLGFQMRRVDVVLEPQSLDSLRAAETEAHRCLGDWQDLAGDVDPETALAARAEIEAYVASMEVADERRESAEDLRRELHDEAEPAFVRARQALEEVCGPYGVHAEQAPADVAAAVDRARHARLQVALSEAQARLTDEEERLDSLLSGAGLPGPTPVGERLSEARARLGLASAFDVPSGREAPAVELELAAAREELARPSHPEWDVDPLLAATPPVDTTALIEEWGRLSADLCQAEQDLPDITDLAARRDALQRRVEELTPRNQSVEQAEMAIIRKFAETRRVGPVGEALPVVVDDAVAEFPIADKWKLLDLVARLSSASQVLYLTDDDDTVAWAMEHDRTGKAALLFVPAGELSAP